MANSYRYAADPGRHLCSPSALPPTKQLAFAPRRAEIGQLTRT